ncbi:MAG TPA: VCBS domain-containing protein, partial [Burkholderiales bacterium]|nr:VCBS domain-containing protein [Burkholderiales bacterium]
TTVTITRVNDNPTVSATGSGGFTESATGTQNLSDTGTVSFTDVDDTDVIDISAAYNGDIVWSGGTLTAGQVAQLTGAGTFVASAINAAAPGSTGWAYTANGVDLNFLGSGETVTFSYTVTATDSQLATATDTVSFTIVGSNDAPTVSATAPVGFTETGSGTQNLSDTGTVSFTDVDNLDLVDISAAYNGDIVWSGGVLTGGQIAQLTGGGTFLAGVINATAPGATGWTYTANGVDLNFLGSGETITFSYSVTATDSQLAAATDTVSFTIVGTNDAPSVTGTASDSGLEDIDQVYTHAQMLTLIGAADVDNANSELIVAISNISNATLVMAGGTGEFGTTFTFTPDANFVGNVLFDYQITDNAIPVPGSSAVGTTTVVLSAVNDSPVGRPAIVGLATQNETITADVSGISDVDGLGTFNYQWLRGGVPIAGATGSSYAIGAADVGYVMSVQVSYVDGFGTTEGPIVSADTPQIASAAAQEVDVPTVVTAVIEAEVTELPKAAEKVEADPEPEEESVAVTTATVPDEQSAFIGFEPQVVETEVAPSELVASVYDDGSSSNDGDAWTAQKKRSMEWLTSQMLFLDGFAESESASIVANVSSAIHLLGENFLDDGEDSDGVKDTIATAMRFTSVALTVGALSWAIRAGGLLTSLLVGMPIWREFDPLPVFAQDDDDEKKKELDSEEHVSDEEEAAAYLLEAGRFDKGVNE